MFPGGMNPRQMKQMMNRMGIKTEEIDAKVVILSCDGKDIVIEGPEVVKMNVQGQEMYSITGGKVREQAVPADAGAEEAVEISAEDVKMVAEQAGVSEDAAAKALADSKGDIAEAIIKLKG